MVVGAPLVVRGPCRGPTSSGAEKHEPAPADDLPRRQPREACGGLKRAAAGGLRQRRRSGSGSEASVAIDETVILLTLALHRC